MVYVSVDSHDTYETLVLGGCFVLFVCFNLNHGIGKKNHEFSLFNTSSSEPTDEFFCAAYEHPEILHFLFSLFFALGCACFAGSHVSIDFFRAPGFLFSAES